MRYSPKCDCYRLADFDIESEDEADGGPSRSTPSNSVTGPSSHPMTTRQAVLASVVDSSHVSLCELLSRNFLPLYNFLIFGYVVETSRKKKPLNDAEIALRREETARKRRNMTEKKLEDEKVFLFLLHTRFLLTCIFSPTGRDDQPTFEKAVASKEQTQCSLNRRRSITSVWLQHQGSIDAHSSISLKRSFEPLSRRARRERRCRHGNECHSCRTLRRGRGALHVQVGFENENATWGRWIRSEVHDFDILRPCQRHEQYCGERSSRRRCYAGR
jgi:PAPA-1-like conserved region